MWERKIKELGSREAVKEARRKNSKR